MHLQIVGYIAAAVLWAVVVPIAWGFINRRTNESAKPRTVIILGAIWPLTLVFVLLILAGRAFLRGILALFNFGESLA